MNALDSKELWMLRIVMLKHKALGRIKGAFSPGQLYTKGLITRREG